MIIIPVGRGCNLKAWWVELWLKCLVGRVVILVPVVGGCDSKCSCSESVLMSRKCWCVIHVRCKYIVVWFYIILTGVGMV